MQDAVERLLKGPERLDGFYYDSRSKRYFPVPRHGGVSWDHYRDTRTHYEKEIQAASEAEKANSSKPSRLHFSRNLATCIQRMRSKTSLAARSSSRKILSEAFLSHQPLLELEIPTDNFTRVIASPSDPDTAYLGSPYRIWKCSLESGRELESYTHNNLSVSGLSICPSNHLLSVSYLSGHLELLRLDSITSSTSVSIPRNSSVWCHSWINSNCLVFGTDRGGCVHDATTGISKGIPMEKSSVFSIATVPNSESTFFVGTRSGKLIHVDIRSSATRFGITKSKITHGSGINHMVPLKDANYIISRSMEGNLYLLDLRMQKDVAMWSNPSTRLSFTESICLDDSETYLASAGTKAMIFDISAPTTEPVAQFDHFLDFNHFIWSRNWLKQRYTGFGAITQGKIEIIEIPS